MLHSSCHCLWYTTCCTENSIWHKRRLAILRLFHVLVYNHLNSENRCWHCQCPAQYLCQWGLKNLVGCANHLWLLLDHPEIDWLSYRSHWHRGRERLTNGNFSSFFLLKLFEHLASICHFDEIIIFSVLVRLSVLLILIGMNLRKWCISNYLSAKRAGGIRLHSSHLRSVLIHHILTFWLSLRIDIKNHTFWSGRTIRFFFRVTRQNIIETR